MTSPFPKPRLNGYGTSFGEYGGNTLTSYEPAGDIDPSRLSKLRMSDAVEFNDFEELARDYILGMLGHPVVRVELTPFQLKQCIHEAITKLDYHAPLWTLQYASFDASVGQNVYELPPYIINNLEYVSYKKNLLSIPSQNGTLEFDFFLKYFQDNFLFGDMNIAEFYQIQQNLEMYRKILSQDGSFNVLNGKYLQISPAPSRTPSPVIVEYRALDSNTIQPAYSIWVHKYALACAKAVLSQIRGKYVTVPSPAGGAQLNGAQLAAESKEEKERLVQELLMEIEEPPTFTTF